MAIPLVQDNSVDSINAAILAIMQELGTVGAASSSKEKTSSQSSSMGITTLASGTTTSVMTADTFSALTATPFTVASNVLCIQFDLGNGLYNTCFDFKFAHTGNFQLKGLSVRPNVAIPSGTKWSILGMTTI